MMTNKICIIALGVVCSLCVVAQTIYMIRTQMYFKCSATDSFDTKTSRTTATTPPPSTQPPKAKPQPKAQPKAPPPKSRPNGRCNNCFKWKYSTVITPRKNLCHLENKSAKIDLVIMIATRHENRGHRDALREMYNSSLWKTHTVRFFFTLGNEPGGNKTKEKELLAENKQHQDILQTSVKGTYWNMTRMVYNGYNWVSENCTNAKFILKISDDAIFNIPGNLHLLDVKGETELQDVLYGHCNAGAGPFRGPKTHKWYVSRDTYPFDRYPPYCSGAGFFVSFKLMNELLKEAGNVAFPNPHDDVFVGTNLALTGNCVCSGAGYDLFGYSGRRLLGVVAKVNDKCEGIQNLGHFMGGHFHGMSPAQMKQFWSKRHCFEPRIPDKFIASLTCRRKGKCPQDNYHIEKIKT